MSEHDTIDNERLSTKYELWSEMPDGYREGIARVSSFQSLAEVVGVLPFSDWMGRVPDFARKQMFIAKIQDEVGHGHITARVAEDLGVPREKDVWLGRVPLITKKLGNSCFKIHLILGMECRALVFLVFFCKSRMRV